MQQSLREAFDLVADSLLAAGRKAGVYLKVNSSYWEMLKPCIIA